MTRDIKAIYEGYTKSLESKKVVVESTETDPNKIAATDPAHDGAAITTKDKKIARYLANKHTAIAKSIAKGKAAAEEEEDTRNNALHSDALFVWDYLLHKKKHSPHDAIKIISMAKTAFEHLL
jgi:hypothetical protein